MLHLLYIGLLRLNSCKGLYPVGRRQQSKNEQIEKIKSKAIDVDHTLTGVLTYTSCRLPGTPFNDVD